MHNFNCVIWKSREIKLKNVIICETPAEVRKWMDVVNKNKKEYVIVCTGHQGEDNAVMTKIAEGKTPFELKENDKIIVAASRTFEPEWAQDLLNFLDIDKYFDLKEIYPGSKILHFKRIQNHFDIPYSEMVFFDDEYRNIEEIKKEVGPKQAVSGYSDLYADIDKGQKILCFFVPGCEHCRDAAKDLNALQKKHKDFPEVKIVFMDEEAEKIPDFFKYVGKQFPYKVIDIIPFWTKLGTGKDTPGVLYIHNGNVIKFFDGIAEKAFNSKAMEKVIYKK